LALGAAGLAFLVAVLGSWVRINNAGLTCPDWPLCRGSVVPALSGGVVLEWSHRAGVFIEAFLVLGVMLAGLRLRAAVRFMRRGLAVLAGVFAIQVLLGGATVELGNSPISVVLHWAMAMALLATLTVLATLGSPPSVADAGAPAPASGRFGEATRGALVTAAACVFFAMCAGAYVSSSHAGLACSSFPLCGPDAFGRGDAQFAQMLHRLAALIVVVAALAAAGFAARSGSSRVRNAAFGGCALVVVQAGLGAANVYAAMPLALRELHAANACLTFVTFVLAATYASLECGPLQATAGQRRVRATQIATSR
jgi:heme A synthase